MQEIAHRAAYDFFIAHAGADAPVAERLYDLLVGDARVFLDSRCLEYGDEWDVVLPRAQRQSRITIVIVSPRTDSAFYQREEVAAANELARREGHRVVPVFVHGAPTDFDDVPYGLRRLHGAELSDRCTIEDVAARVLALAGKPAPAAAPRGGQARSDIAAVDADGHALGPSDRVEISRLFRSDETVTFMETALIRELVEARVGQGVIGTLAVTTKRLAFLTVPLPPRRLSGEDSRNEAKMEAAAHGRA